MVGKSYEGYLFWKAAREKGTSAAALMNSGIMGGRQNGVVGKNLGSEVRTTRI